MEQFSLDKYIENPSRKITTRYGNREVRIICTDRKDKRPIVALMIDINDGSEYITSHSINGWIDDEEKYPDKRDLFFADEEEDLSEFESKLADLLVYNHPMDIEHAESIAKKKSKQLIDLARKEIEANYYTKVLDDRVVFKSDLHDRDMQGAYELGKQDALKDLPKWKKMPSGIQGNGNFYPIYLVRVSNEHYYTTPCLSWDEGSMYIELSELEKLPKE